MSEAATGSVPRAFQVMSKPTGAICTLDRECRFFLAEEALYPGSSCRMPREVHEGYVQQLPAGHTDGEEAVVASHGGEPTLRGIDVFRRTIALERRFALPGQRNLSTLPIDGTLSDDEWGRFLSDHDVLAGWSVDGPRAVHDACRVDKGGARADARQARIDLRSCGSSRTWQACRGAPRPVTTQVRVVASATAPEGAHR